MATGDTGPIIRHDCNYRPIRSIEDLTVLIVDDNSLILDICRDLLNGMGLPLKNIFTAGAVDDAIYLLENRKSTTNPFSMVLSDVDMPPKSGYDVVSYLVERNFNTKIILMSGEAEDIGFKLTFVGKSIFVPKRARVHGFLRKPFQVSELQAMVDSVLEEYQDCQ